MHHMSKKKTLAQNFADIFRMYMGGTTEHERDTAKNRAEAWLKRHAKTWKDVAEILAQAGRDDAAQQPSPPPPPDPRDAASHPFDDPEFTPVGIVYEAAGNYLYMSEHVRITGGAYAPFDSESSAQLRELLRAVAVFATGGLAALQDQRSEAAVKLLGQIRR